MNMNKVLISTIRAALFLAAVTLISATGRAQSTAYWTNSAGGEWNTAANWNVDLSGFNAPPAEGTNADIGSQGAAVVSYDLPMAATSFGLLSVQAGSTLNVNTNGFNLNGGGAATPLITLAGILNVTTNGVLTATNGGAVTISAGTALNVSGNAVLMTATATATNPPLAIAGTARLNITNGVVTISNSGRITMPTDSTIDVEGGAFIMTNNPVGASGINLGANGNNNGAGFTNNGGIVILDQRFESRGRFSRFIMNGGVLKLGQGTNGIFETANDQERQWLINGGTADLGDFVISRTLPSPGAGLVISNGAVSVTSLQVGNNASRAFATIYGGTLTNTGAFLICDRNNGASGERRIQFLIRGGSVVSTGPAGIIIANQANNVNNGIGSIGGILDVNAGTLTAEGITLIKDNTLTNAYATLLLSGSGSIYLGTVGLVANTGPSNTSYVVTMSGGTLGAKAHTTLKANMTLSGTTPTFRAADAGGNPFNITHNGIISSSGTLNKTGGGTLILNTNDTYSGGTFINAGTLALGATGSISNSAQIVVAAGATFDVSALSAFNLAANRTLAGGGTVMGNVTAQTGSTIVPGSSAGTLVISGNLSEAGGVTHNFELSSTTSDLIQVGGTLDLSTGTDSILVSAISGTIPAGTYPLFQYGSLVGDETHLAVSGAPGVLTNDTVAKTISLVTPGVRAPTSVTWVGSPANASWDSVGSAAHTNWLNSGVPDFFVSGDNVRFDDTGAAHPVVDVISPGVAPGSITVDATVNYTLSGNGNISGAGSTLTKTNSGTLTILTTNSYSGPTILGGGTLEASTIRNNGSPSSIGATTTDPINLQFDGGMLRYLGSSASSDRGATANSDAVIEIATGASTLTLSGTVTGNGGVTKLGPGALVLSGVNPYAGMTTVSNGTLQINGASSVTTSLGTNAVNLAGGTLFLNVGGQPTYGFTLNLLADSGINVAANNTVFLPTAWSGASSLNVNVNSGGFFTFNSEFSPAFTGTVALGTSAGVLRFNAGGSSGGAQQCTGSSNVVFDLGSSTAVLINRNGGGASFGNYYLGGLAGSGSSTELRGSENAGSPCTYFIGDRNLSTTFAGAIRNGHANTSTPQASAAVTIVKVGSGTLTLTGTNDYSGSTVISNGVLALSGFGSIGNSASIIVPSNATLNVSGRADGTLTLNNGQTLRGSGTVQGGLTAGSGSFLTVGDFDNLPDLLTVNGALVLQANSTLNLDLDWYQFFQGRTNDSIQGTTSVTYGGTLNLNVLSVETNSVFKLFNAGSYSGSFSSIVPATPPLTSKAWDTSFLTVDGTLRITIQRPNFTTIVPSGTDLIISGANGIPGAEYHVLVSTNAALPVAQWTSIATNFFAGTDFQFTLSNAINPATPQQFYLLQVITP
jgi:autotransporter-associated beta strand protein